MLLIHPDRGDHRLLTLAQLAPLGSWQLDLVHDRRASLLIWITRGQGLALLDGARRGIGAHNALFIPAGHLMSLDLGRQGFGQALILPEPSDQTLPTTVLHLRIRDVIAQSEMTTIFESLGREQNGARPLSQGAMAAYAALAGIWLRRHISEADPRGQSQGASRRLMRGYFSRLVTHYANGDSMADHAEALGVTPTHLTRVCKAETGRTAASLLSERIIYRARTDLAETDLAIQEIASGLGFGSAAYFTRFIQQHTGCTPTALRRAARDSRPRLGA